MTAGHSCSHDGAAKESQIESFLAEEDWKLQLAQKTAGARALGQPSALPQGWKVTALLMKDLFHFSLFLSTCFHTISECLRKAPGIIKLLGDSEAIMEKWISFLFNILVIGNIFTLFIACRY